MNTTTAPLLLVEDDPMDLFLLQRALKKAQITLPQRVATNGEQAISYLSGKVPFADPAAFPTPQAILLDLKMPFLNGFEVLKWIRSQPQLASVQVFVLTGSSIASDRDRALSLGAQGYLVKPPQPEELAQILGALRSLPVEKV